MDDSNWPDFCNVLYCDDPSKQPHHHHRYLGGDASLVRLSCQCGNVEEPGTKPKEM